MRKIESIEQALEALGRPGAASMDKAEVLRREILSGRWATFEARQASQVLLARLARLTTHVADASTRVDDRHG